MYLEKLKIQGFKSFADKNILVFPGMVDKTRRGITAVVGPNGSGKSNIADAIRWALGEQSMKTLRGKKSEDVIFSGSDRKGKLGMAEVSLYFNNTEKSKGIDFSELVLTRRLYRNGDSEYLMNGSRARLNDIQIMLAKANFGQKTYSVIGQGLVEGFLNTTLAERKAFFDEATGVKQYQIKRDDSLNKLRSSYENLSQVNMLITEIEPRLKSLTRQVNKLKKRDEVKNELKKVQLKYYSKIWHETNSKFSEHNNKFLEYEKIKRDNDKKLEILNRDLEKTEHNRTENNEIEIWQNNIKKLRQKRDNLVKNIAQLDAQLEIKLESKGQFDLSWLNNKKEELIKNKKDTKEEIDNLKNNIESGKKAEELFYEEKKALDAKLSTLNKELLSFNLKELRDEDGDIKKSLRKSLEKLKKIDSEENLEKIKIIIKEVKEKIKELIDINEVDENKEKIEDNQNRIINLTNEKEKVFIKINDNNLRISARSERVKLLNEKREGIKDELRSIEKKIKGNKNKVNLDEIENEKKKIKTELNEIDEKMKAVSNKINERNMKEEDGRNKIILIQKNIQSLQNEINSISRKLGELRVNSARHETRLEDLEIEIRNNFGDLGIIKRTDANDDFNREETQEKINNLKRQLELIGGIDPSVEKEYVETKERYDFFYGQSSDLEKAIGSLEEIVKELDLKIKEKFDKEFKVISKKFEEYFKILFNGGNAKIIKVMDNPLESSGQAVEGDENNGESEEEITKKTEQENRMNKIDLKRIKFLKKHNATGLAGIEIQATPPGKKIKSISMLSGGERALTAIAMISAIISANPAPFVVLDEVDAALDEANSERLAKILDDLSHKTQFIIVTHNRASMRRANTLYGVTMGEDGISKLLSVKLEDIVKKQ